jgi:predicted MFS family arabinose efflux permease
VLSGKSISYGVLASIGIGFVPIPLLSLVARWFVKGRGLASGVVVAGSGLGMAVVPPLANLIISDYSWRTAYLVLGAVALVVIIAFAQLLRRAPGQSSSAEQEDNRKTDSSNLQTQGLTLREAAGTMSLWNILVMGFFFFFGIQTILVHIPAHATDIGFSSATAASILSVIGFVNIGGTLAGGILGDKIGARETLIIIFI